MWCEGCGASTDGAWWWCPHCGGPLSHDAQVIDLRSNESFPVEWAAGQPAI
jgi:predicted amidophosphoribosyltransferase